jgi:hypothetical protein
MLRIKLGSTLVVAVAAAVASGLMRGIGRTADAASADSEPAAL